MTGKCRVCGCTDDQACEGGCSWAEPDLCSKCAAKKKRIRVSAENYKELVRLTGELQTKLSKPVTVDEVITHMCKQFGQAGVVEPAQE